VPLLLRAPKLAPLAVPVGGGYVRLPDATDGCWFLREDGMCSYEQSHGRAAKFLTCRLFPFNRVFRVGSVRVVDFNSVVCPLEDAYGSGRGVTYRELLDELDTAPDGPLINSPAEPPEGARELRWLALEQGLLEDSAAHLEALDYVMFAELQSARSQRHLGEIPRPSDDAGLYSLVELWSAVYGVALGCPAWQSLRATTARRLTLLTPSLRWNALFKRGAAPYRQQLPDLPRKLLATWFLGVLAATVPGAQPPGSLLPLSLRSLTELHQAQAPLRDLLARLDQPARLDRPLSAADMPDDIAAALRQLSRALSAPTPPRQPLGQLLLEAAAALPPGRRALLPALLLRTPDSLHFPPH
jgi:hypothetical protein